MKKRKKIRWILTAAVIAAAVLVGFLLRRLSSSGDVPFVSVLGEKEPENQTTALQPRPAESMEQEIEDPVYVYLKEENTKDPNLIFRQWADNDETAENQEVDKSKDKAETGAQHQDVSDVQNAVAIPSVYGNAGEEVSAEVRLCGQVELGGFDLRVTYDPQFLKYLDCANADEDLILNCDEEKGIVFINLLKMVNIKDAHKICDLKFQVVTESDCDTPLGIEMVEAISFGENGEIVFCNYSLVEAQVHLNEALD